MLHRTQTQKLLAMLGFVMLGGLIGSAQQPAALTDHEVTAAINNEFLTDASVPFHRIDVRTNDGIVSLSGHVLNLLHRERAAEVAMAIRGVRSVINHIEVVPAARSDARVRRDVVDALLRDPVADEYEIQTRVDTGVVTLSGTVDSWAEKRVVLTVARGVRGVRAVHDQIQVEPGIARPDPELRDEVERRLDMDARIDAELIDVSVSDGRVDLTGAVGSAAERHLAYSNAWVAGVSHVGIDELDVKQSAHDETIRQNSRRPTDDEVADAIRLAFTHDPRVHSEDLEVRVTDGVVNLSGIVTTRSARHAAEMDAANTVGVRRVHNHLRVRPEGSVTDAELAEQVRRELRRDPWVDASEVSVHVSDHTVYLSRTVDSHWEKTRAEAAANNVDGVVDVVNNLVVTWDLRPKSDWEISEDVRSHLYWNPFVDAGAITIEVDDGVVTLTGTVRSTFARNAATDEAYDGGAVRVRNNLNITV